MRSLQWKITAIYAALAATVVIVIGVTAGSRLESYLQSRTVDRLTSYADLFVSILQSDRSTSFHEIESRVRKIPGVDHLRVMLIGGNGETLADSDLSDDRSASGVNLLHQPEVEKALKDSVGSDIRKGDLTAGDMVYVARLVASPAAEGRYPGLKFIRLSMPLDELRAEMNLIRWNIFFSGFIVFLLIAAFSVVVSRRIAKPMVRISDGLEEIRTGILNKHIEISSDDEIGRVAEAVNGLVDKLNADRVEMEKLQRTRSEFLANVSHELRTPIFAIQGMIETLLNGAIDDPAVNKSFLEKAQSNAARLDALLTDLINISQIEAGEMRMSFRYFSLKDFLESTVKDLQPVGAQRHVALVFEEKTKEATEIYGDRGRLRQVMENLIENGLRYNKEGGEVRVVAEDSEGGVMISVIDTGIGIAPEHVSRIFERFYRVDKDRSREVGGTGLGLAIVKHILEAHGTRAEVLSTPGKGSMFRFVIRSG
ncbi:MAG TPA: ATP-binding protein [Bacteroidota bacterium]|nr:ATP-binding protein [Bacteroidota bacterium]